MLIIKYYQPWIEFLWSINKSCSCTITSLGYIDIRDIVKRNNL